MHVNPHVPTHSQDRQCMEWSQGSQTITMACSGQPDHNDETLLMHHTQMQHVLKTCHGNSSLYVHRHIMVKGSSPVWCPGMLPVGLWRHILRWHLGWAQELVICGL